MNIEGSPKRVRIVALTPRGSETAYAIGRELEGSVCFIPARYADRFDTVRKFDRFSDVVEEAFRLGEDLVCVMAAGIVVRTIAPYLKTKTTDPAVVVVDELGRYAISLLSGHLGGANALARKAAAITGGEAVITTATDTQGLPAFDVIAGKSGLVIEDMDALRRIHMALLESIPVHVVDPEERLSESLEPYFGEILIRSTVREAEHLEEAGTPVVYVGGEEGKWPNSRLRLRPRELVAGVGCNSGTSSAEILGLIRDTFDKERLAVAGLRAVACIDAKRNEPGILEAAKQLGVECLWFTAKELGEVTVPNPSEVVEKHMGVRSVSEAAALKGANATTLLVEKRKSTNATLAVARAVSPS